MQILKRIEEKAKKKARESERWKREEKRKRRERREKRETRKACSTSLSGGNQVDGSPPGCSTGSIAASWGSGG